MRQDELDSLDRRFGSYTPTVEFKELQEKVHSMEFDLDRVDFQIIEIQYDVGTLESTVNDGFASVDNDLSQMNQTILGQSAKLEILETNQNNQAAEIIRLDGTIGSLEHSVIDIQASIVDLQSSDETLAGTISETQGN